MKHDDEIDRILDKYTAPPLIAVLGTFAIVLAVIAVCFLIFRPS